MPYDNDEYNDLMEKVKHRRRKEIGKELCGGREVSYSVKAVCKSYLDSHKGNIVLWLFFRAFVFVSRCSYLFK